MMSNNVYYAIPFDDIDDGTKSDSPNNTYSARFPL